MRPIGKPMMKKEEARALLNKVKGAKNKMVGGVKSASRAVKRVAEKIFK